MDKPKGGFGGIGRQVLGWGRGVSTWTGGGIWREWREANWTTVKYAKPKIPYIAKQPQHSKKTPQISHPFLSPKPPPPMSSIPPFHPSKTHSDASLHAAREIECTNDSASPSPQKKRPRKEPKNLLKETMEKERKEGEEWVWVWVSDWIVRKGRGSESRVVEDGGFEKGGLRFFAGKLQSRYEV